MAKIGLKYPAFATIGDVVETGTIGKAVTSNLNITVSDVKLFGDDGVAESDRGFQSGTIELTTTDLSTEVQGTLLGHEVTEGKLVAKASDLPPYVKFGFYAMKQVNNVRSWRAIILHKVQFGEPSDENTTKGETVAFGTPSITGTILTDDNGAWKTEQTFETESEARTFVNTELGITEE